MRCRSRRIWVGIPIPAISISSADAGTIAFLKLAIAKLRRELYGHRSERKERLVDELELQLDGLDASATEAELAAERAAAESTEVQGFTRRRSGRTSFAAHLPRERVVVPGPPSCPCWGSVRLSKIGSEVTETREVILRR